LTLGLAGLLVLAACAPSAPAGPTQAPLPAPAPPKTLGKIVIAQGSDTLGFGPVYIAVEQGYFKDEGLDAELVTVGGGPVAVSALTGGSAQIGLSAATSTISAVANGAPVAILSALTTEYETKLAMRKNLADGLRLSATSPLADRITALKGKKIGITSAGSGTDKLVRLILQKASINPDTEVDLIPLRESATMLAALQQGSVDVIALSSPTPDRAVAEGYGIYYISPAELPEMANFVYHTASINKRLAEQQPELLSASLKAIWRALELLQKDRPAAKAALRQHYGQMDDKTFELAFESVYPNFAKSPLPTEMGFKKAVDFEGFTGKVTYQDTVAAALFERANQERQGTTPTPDRAPAAAAPKPTVAPTVRALKKVKLGIPGISFGWAPALLAVSKDYFREEGLDVEVVQTQAGPGIMNAVVSGNVDLAVNVLASNAQAVKGGLPTKPVAFAAMVGEHSHQLVVKKDLAERIGVTRASSLNEKITLLRGTRIGITAVGSGGDKLTRRLLASGGITSPDTDVEITAVGNVDNVVAAFVANRIDGYLLTPPLTDLGVAHGNGVMLLDFSRGEWPSAQHATYTVLFAAQPYIASNPDVVLAATRSIEKALKFFQANPAAANSALKERFFPNLEADLFTFSAQANERALATTVVLDEAGVVRSIRLNLDDAEGMTFADLATNEFAAKAAAELASWKP
jgi:NitT/TauT family transport system substrate-binding protein